MEALNLHYDVSGNDFTCAGEASGKIKKTLKELGFPNSTVRNVAIAVYEGEINMVIHAGGGVIDAVIEPECISLVLTDHGPGIPNVELAMKEGWSTAPENVRQLGRKVLGEFPPNLCAGDPTRYLLLYVLLYAKAL